jgi:hypothetical protein
MKKTMGNEVSRRSGEKPSGVSEPLSDTQREIIDYEERFARRDGRQLEYQRRDAYKDRKMRTDLANKAFRKKLVEDIKYKPDSRGRKVL